VNKEGKLTVGIDATNLRGGGGVTHLVELLGALDTKIHRFNCIVVWGGDTTLGKIAERTWLIKKNLSMLNKGLLFRTFWQIFFLSRAAKKEGCDILFVPGGSYMGTFHPVVTMSQNLLPFESVEMRRYGFTFFTLKLLLLRLIQAHSFRRSDGVIFLTKYARDSVLKCIGKVSGVRCIVPHGLNSRFSRAPRPQFAMAKYNASNPYQVLYVSSVDLYKHQWHVVEAVSILREKGLPIILNMIGPGYGPAIKRLNEAKCRFDPDGLWALYHGAVPFDSLHNWYERADMSLFASSCENMPNILLEAMGSGLPVACSSKGPMPEILGSAGVYFDPERPANIAGAILRLAESPKLREKLAGLSFECSQRYTWENCALSTFHFLSNVASIQRANSNSRMRDLA
jgi:glycosyltransferase involved in cell wall biosynthesis